MIRGMVFREVEYYYIVKGSLKAPQYLNNLGKWTNDLRKAIPFISEKLADEHLQSSKLRSGRVAFWEGIWTTTHNGVEYDSELRELNN